MPKSLPEGALKIWERVYDQAIKDGDKEDVAAKKAWGGVKQAGWKKNEEGKWEKKAQLSSLSLTIKRASFDATTNTMRWRADTSNVKEDSYGDSMTSELFEDFLSRIETKEMPPEEFRSGFWQGGTPYLSVSHYSDLNGAAVPGEVEKVYVDGDYLKAKGTFNNDTLGKACWQAIKADLASKSENPVRISIAFLDYAHSHGDYTFERKADDDICPMCLLAMLKGEMPKRQFKKGHLIHFAMTRVPVNVDTIMEEDKSMTTRKEDAASIIGEELAEEIEQKSALVGKSEAMLVIKSDGEETEEETKEEMGVTMSAVSTTEIITLSDVMGKIAELSTSISGLVDILSAKAKDEKKPMPEDEEKETEDEEDEMEEEKKAAVEMKSAVESLAIALSEAMQPTNQKLDIMIAALSANKTNTVAPERRSISPADVARSMVQRDPNKPLSFGELAKKSVGL